MHGWISFVVSVPPPLIHTHTHTRTHTHKHEREREKKNDNIISTETPSKHLPLRFMWSFTAATTLSLGGLTACRFALIRTHECTEASSAHAMHMHPQ